MTKTSAKGVWLKGNGQMQISGGSDYIVLNDGDIYISGTLTAQPGSFYWGDPVTEKLVRVSQKLDQVVALAKLLNLRNVKDG